MEYRRLVEFLEKNNVQFSRDYFTHKLSSFEIGNEADIVVFPENLELFCEILSIVYEDNIKFCIVGKGTNTLFSDNGYRGVIISTRNLSKIFVNDDEIIAYCGASLTDCAMLAMKKELSGMESFCGIPGSIGGAIYINASAFNKSISELVKVSVVYDLKTKKKRELTLQEHLFETKSSCFLKNKNLVLLHTKFILEKADKNKIHSAMLELATKRIISQPLDKGNCGSVFKRPVKFYASKLIDDLSLKGFKIGGAEVSKKHAGFIVNCGNATSSDVLNLIFKIKSMVLEKFKVLLEEEIIFVE